MVHAKSKRARKSSDGSDSDTESVDWDELLAENVPKTSAAAKGKAAGSSKAKTPPTAADKGKAPLELRSRRQKTCSRKSVSTRGVEIREPTSQNVVASARIKEFENRECIGERHVHVKALKERSKAFGTLFDQAGLGPICTFPETTGFCLQMVRAFYQNACYLTNTEDGPKEFITFVRNIRIKVTPQLIGEVLGMDVRTNGIHYLKGHLYNNTFWRVIVDGICVPDTRSAGNSVYSKELRPEYRFLHYIVCYNILPNMNTKVLRWDRMLFLYLIGNPAASMGSNFNIPYLIWTKMTKFLESTRASDRLPFPMIIMRIFRRLNIDTESTSYMHSLGTINESTIVKSLSTKPDEVITPPRARRTQAAPAATAAPAASTSASVSENASVSTIQRRMSDELITISGRLDKIEKKQQSFSKMLRSICKSLKCSGSEGSD